MQNFLHMMCNNTCMHEITKIMFVFFFCQEWTLILLSAWSQRVFSQPTWLKELIMRLIMRIFCLLRCESRHYSWRFTPPCILCFCALMTELICQCQCICQRVRDITSVVRARSDLTNRMRNAVGHSGVLEVKKMIYCSVSRTNQSFRVLGHQCVVTSRRV